MADFNARGGAMIAYVSASWPLARLSATADALVLSVLLLGTFRLRPEEVVALEVERVFFTKRLRIRHNRPDLPERLFFATLSGTADLPARIAAAGFEPRAAPSASESRGFPMRIWPLLLLLLAWNLVFAGGARDEFLSVEQRAFMAGIGLLALAILYVPAIARLFLRPSRSIGEAAPYLRLMAFLGLTLAMLFPS